MIAENVKRIKEEIFETCIKCGRNYSDIEIVGVTKTVDPERILPIKNAGITHIGENRVQEFLEKYEVYKDKFKNICCA